MNMTRFHRNERVRLATYHKNQKIWDYEILLLDKVYWVTWRREIYRFQNEITAFILYKIRRIVYFRWRTRKKKKKKVILI